MLRTDDVKPQHEAIHYDWNHDINGTLFQMSVKVEKDFPQFANHWFDSVQGGYQVTFKDDEGNEYEATTDKGVRCCGCVGVIAFDS
jgi:hypothetical protein